MVKVLNLLCEITLTDIIIVIKVLRWLTFTSSHVIVHWFSYLFIFCFFIFAVYTVLLLLSSYILLQLNYHLHKLKKCVTFTESMTLYVHRGKNTICYFRQPQIVVYSKTYSLLCSPLKKLTVSSDWRGESLEKWAPLADEEKVFIAHFNVNLQCFLKRGRHAKNDHQHHTLATQSKH